MKMGYSLLGMSISLSLLAGCATLSEEECLTGNWESIGFADGAAGRSSSYLTSHNKACAKVGVTTNYQLWEKGRQQGLKKYCTATNAYTIGRQGSYMNSVCPASIMPKLEQINKDGRLYYSINQQLRTEKEQLKKYSNEYQQLRSGNNLSFSNERDARSYLIELPSKIYKVNDRIDNLEYALEQLQYKYGY